MSQPISHTISELDDTRGSTTGMSFWQKILYAPTFAKNQFISLKPPREPIENPIRVLRLLTGRQWAYFFLGFFGWCWDAFDLSTVTLNVSPISTTLGRPPSDITWGITASLMVRSLGAIASGYTGDRYGRRWPYVANMILMIVSQLGTGFVKTYGQFIGCRIIFGIAMGGMFGNASTTAVEDAPLEARGILSGLVLGAYSFGGLLAACFNLAITAHSPYGWRALFWFGAGPPVLLIVFRLCVPETKAFHFVQETRKAAEEGGNPTFFFKHELIPAIRNHYWRLIYLVLLMAGFNFMPHGSQDLYPTFLERQIGMSANTVTVLTIISNLGGLIGGGVGGHLSTFVGRRLTVIISACLGGAMIAPWVLVRNNGIIAAAFFEQFFIQAAVGVVPVYLVELSPGDLRTLIVGTCYQLGNLASAASSTIEATLGERFPLPPLPGGVARYDYGKVMAIFMGCVFGYVIILATVGPEKRNQDPILEIVEALPNEKDGDFEANPHGVKRGASQVEDIQLAE